MSNRQGLNTYGPPGGSSTGPIRSASSSSLNTAGRESTRPVGSMDKVEEGLAVHIKKALSPEETAPKQKHVRACIVYTWDTRSSASFWMGLKLTPILGDEVMCWKALVTLHKVIRDGHPSTLKDAMHETAFIESVARSVAHQMGARLAGYGVLIRAYVQYVLSKLEFHRVNPEFNANFQYEEYVSLKGTLDPNEGYEKVMDLLGLLDKLDAMQKLIFANLRPTSNNECRISALVPLVEESWGLYSFLKSMLAAMHQRVATAEPLEPLVERFSAAHFAMRQFYFEAAGLKYLTSLIQIPRLPAEPPTFVASGREVVLRRPSPPPEAPAPPAQEADLLNLQTGGGPPVDQQQLMLQQQQMQMQLRFEEEQRRLEQERMRLLMEQQLSQQQQQQMQASALQRLQELERELLEARERAARDRDLIDAYDRRMKALEKQLQDLGSTRMEADDAKDDLIRRLREEAAQWKAKYEALVKLYSQLRREHLELLQKLKDLKDGEARATEAARGSVTAAQDALRAKGVELADALREKQRLEGELARAREGTAAELERLRHELENARREVSSLGASKGAEVEALVAQFGRERSDLEARARAQQASADEMARELDRVRSELSRVQGGVQEETAVLRAGMDQSLMALKSLQISAQDTESGLLRQMDKMTAEHAGQLSRILDAVFEACIRTVRAAGLELEARGTTAASAGSVAPEFVLTVIEKAQGLCSDFAAAMVSVVEGGDKTEAIGSANQFAQGVAQVLDAVGRVGGHGAAGADELLEALFTSARAAGERGAEAFFAGVMSGPLGSVPAPQRPALVDGKRDATAKLLAELAAAVDRLVVREQTTLTAREEEIGDVVERELMAAAFAIQEAATRLSGITSGPGATATELNVHRAILDAALAMAAAVGNLVKYATLAQQEIVAHGKGSASKGAFYKQNNRWTEGLISAAKTVAIAVNLLVESADGVVRGTHSMERLVVAATEVSAATTQLVAASRVKAVAGSKTQDKLEGAAAAVREAVRALVKAAKDSAARAAADAASLSARPLGAHEYKVQEMEQQVQILELEKNLSTARQRLAEMRRRGYQGVVN